MYLRIELENAFVHSKFVYDFKEGLTVISGLNGKGKSLIPELAEFACWGVQALRGKVDGYKGMKVALNLMIREDKYRIERTISTANLFRWMCNVLNDEWNWVKIATGVTPVNQKIAELFGYSYDVFKVTNVARQGEIELMGQMKPTARKALIDETIGLAKIEALAEWAKTQESNANAAIKALESSMGSEPEPLPVAPPEVSAQDVMVLQSLVSTYDTHAPYLTRPEEVLPHPRTEEYAALAAQQKAREAALVQHKSLTKAIDGFPAIGVAPSLHPQDAENEALVAETNKHLDAKQLLKQYVAAMKAFPYASTYTEEELKECEITLGQLKDWYRREALRQEQVEYTCEKCNHVGHIDNPELALYANLPEEKPVPKLVSQSQVDEMRRINGYQADRNALVEAVKITEKTIAETQDNSSLSLDILRARQALSAHQIRLESESHRLALIQERDAIVIPDDVSDTIQDIQISQVQVSSYKDALSRHLQARVAVDQIPADIKFKLVEAMSKREAHVLFLEKVRSYSEKKKAWDINVTNLSMLSEEKADWKKVRQAILDLRLKVKGFLLPSLNDVASRLINLMSKGWLTKTAVDEDFEMRTDGKLVDLLSGAGKTLTNLALRIGLGQVLTNNVFSCLVLDEADAGVDIEKAPMVAEAMKALTGVISQVIIISHKQGLVADHRLEL